LTQQQYKSTTVCEWERAPYMTYSSVYSHTSAHNYGPVRTVVRTKGDRQRHSLSHLTAVPRFHY